MELKVQTKLIGEGHPIFIVAEVSVNHLQNFDLAVKTIHAAKEVGADAVKFQAYTPDTMTIESDREHFKINQNTPWDGKTLYQLYQEGCTPWEWLPRLKRTAEDVGLIFFATPFDKTAVNFLEGMGVEVYKIASFEITDIPLIRYVASKNKPVIISTGIADWPEIEAAIDTCRGAGNGQIALLKCTSAYPASYDEANLRVIPNFKEVFKVVVGLSDHTLGIAAPVAAVALGAKIIEKHIILDKSMPSLDKRFSLDKPEFRLMVEAIRQAEESLGNGEYELSPSARKNRAFSRSLFVIKDIKGGEPFSQDNIKSIRPGFGLAPKHLDEIIGKKAKRDLTKGTPLTWEVIEK